VKCGSLKDRNKKEEFLEELSEEYEEIREEHYDSLKVNSLFDTCILRCVGRTASSGGLPNLPCFICYSFVAGLVKLSFNLICIHL